ncbi:MAG: VOC family protein [Vicinamibacterales bacterium]
MADKVAGRIMPIIAVPSVDATRSFYVDTLGFQHVMGMIGKDGHLDFCTVVLGAASIMFNRAAGAPAAVGRQPVDIYLEVADVDALHDTLKKKGVAISDPLTMQWWGDRTFKVMDPNGYEIWFYTNVAEPVPPAGAKLV